MTEAIGVELAVQRWGSGPKRALLLHGIGSAAAGWWRLGPDLAELGFVVDGPDLRGHGLSPKPAEMSLEGYAEDVRHLGDHWDLVIAHSLGGSIVLAGGLAASGWTERLVLEDPAILGSDDPEVVAWLLEEFDGPIDPATIASSNPTWHPTDAALKAEALLQCGPEAIQRTMDHSGAWNLWDELLAVEVPTLLIGADPKLGALVSPELGQTAAAGNPRIRYESVVGASHSMHRDEYDTFWTLVQEFAAE